MTAPIVLVVDGEQAARSSLSAFLSLHGFRPKAVASGEAALREVEGVRPDVILLDLQVRGIGGLEACKRIRSRWPIPIIVISDTADEATTVEALESGADDYLTRPLRMNEVAARVKVALRRTLGTQPEGAPVFRSGDLSIDAGKREVALAGRPIHVTPTEYELLRYLAAHAGQIVTYSMLMRAVWGEPERASRHALRCAVAQLRRKLNDSAAQPRYLITEPSIGVRLAQDGEICAREHQSGYLVWKQASIA